MPTEQTPWYLVRVKPGQHKLALSNLARQGIEVFAPLRAHAARRFGRLQQVVEPAFPGYLFVRFAPGVVRWRALNSTYGVAKVVSFQPDRPATVPTELIEQIRLRCDEQGLLRSLDELQPGDRVRIVDGPFADLVCSVDSLSGGERVRLLLAVMGREVPLTVRRASLIRTEGP